MTDNKGEIIIYIKEDGRTQIDVKLQGNRSLALPKAHCGAFRKGR